MTDLLAAGAERPFGAAFALIGVAAVVLLVGLFALLGGRHQHPGLGGDEPHDQVSHRNDRNEDA